MNTKAKTIVVAAASVAFGVAVLSASPALAKGHHHGIVHHSHTSHGKKGRAPSRPVQDARKLFAAKTLPAALPVSAIGSYVNGCAAGSVAMPKNGATWQVMRLSRNRYWGNPRMIKYIEDLSVRAKKDGWNGVLIGDIANPRGGPMIGGHASHNIGLDADLWLEPAPDHVLSDEEREKMSAPSVTKIDSADLNMSVWTQATANFIRDAAQDSNVQRVFITPAGKKFLCTHKDPHGADTWWLKKLRPCGTGSCEGHNDHIHVRLTCTPGDTACHGQSDVDNDDGCGSELTAAYNATVKDPPFQTQPPGPPGPPPAPKKPFPLTSMPAMCVKVLNAKP